MRIVLDTNVLVSALLKPGSVPDRAIEAMRRAGVRWLYDARIAREYREVLARPKFRDIPAAPRDALLAALLGRGEDLGDVVAWSGPLIDDGDRMFVEAALAGRATAIVTGNAKHFPRDLAFAVVPPARLLAMLT